MRAILISIKPKWAEKILNGEKTIEVRKSTALYKAIQKLIDENGYAEFYVYCSKINRKDYHLIESITDKGETEYEVDYYIGSEGYLDYCFDGKVMFKFRCYNVEEILIKLNGNYYTNTLSNNKLLTKSCLSQNEIFEYTNAHVSKIGCYLFSGYAIHISDLEIFDKPKELSEFYTIVKEKVKTDCPFNCKGYCFTNYDCKYYVEDDGWGGQLACSCPTKEVNIKKRLTKAPQNFCYVEVEDNE